MIDEVKEAKIGSIVPVYREIDEEIDAVDYFAKLSNNGKKKHSLLFEHDGYSFGTANPCLVVIGKGNNFEIRALNETGKRFLSYIRKDFGFCDKATYNRDKIQGILTPSNRAVSEDQRLKAKTHMDIIRAITYKFKPKTSLNIPYCGVTGMVASGTIHDGDKLSYLYYFVDNMFLVDHDTKSTYFISNAIITDNKKDKIYSDCSKTLNAYEKLVSKKSLKMAKGKKKKFETEHITGKDELFLGMKAMKKKIVDGSVLYASVSSMAMCNYYADPLLLYSAYKELDSGNTYFVNYDEGIAVSASAGFNLDINDSSVNLSMVTSKKPRGRGKDEIDNDLDNKYEALLKADVNEIAKHTILADAARNEAAKVCAAGTRYMEKFFSDDKNGSYHNLTLSVKGVLKDDMDALHAYSSIKDYWVGVTKTNSLDILSALEKHDKGFHSGSVVMASVEGNLSSVSINCLEIKKDNVSVLVSSDVFHNSDDGGEAEDNGAKMNSILGMVKEAGGLK